MPNPKNGSCLRQKRQKWWMELPEGSWFGTNANLLHGVIGPISMPNEYLNACVKYLPLQERNMLFVDRLIK